VTPDDPIVRFFLEHSRVLRLATLSPAGRPALTPLWFVMEGGRLLATTGRATLAARNAAADPRVVLLLDAEAAGRSAHVLRLHGRATVHGALPSWRALARLAWRHYAAPPALRAELAHAGQWSLRRRYYAQSEGATITIEPDRAELLRRPDGSATSRRGVVHAPGGATVYRDLKRWLYRGNRPHALARALNRGWAIAGARGLAPDHLVTLEVRGRRSGRTISFPLVMAVVDGDRFLVSMLGADVNWVRNVKAAGGRALLRHGRSESVRLEELPPERRAPVLKAYLQRAPGARPHVAVDKDAPLAAFAAIAAEIPVFRVLPSTP
jgi:hypothetical protein